MRVQVSTVIALALAVPSISLARQADRQTFPTNVSLEKVVRSGLVSTFKDPDSAQINITRGPRRATAVTDTKTYSGWLLCAKINAKNSYGAYTGYADYLVVVDPESLNSTPLPRLTSSDENVNAWRSECILKHEDDPAPPAV